MLFQRTSGPLELDILARGEPCTDAVKNSRQCIEVFTSAYFTILFQGPAD
jgi:hypothetical protein